MKKTTPFFIAIILFVFSANAQQKILFDNTKSEEAGNADWVIDHSEPAPVPSQSNITSSTSETYWDGAISAWGVEMVQRGYFVETLPSYRDITYGNSSNSQDLSNYDVYVLCEPNNPFTSSEKTAIINFVQNGGGLFIISDHYDADRDNDGWDAYGALNDLMTNNSITNNPFGMLFSNESYINDYPNKNMINDATDPLLHGDAGNVSGMEFHGSATMTINKSANPTVKAVVYRSSYSTTGTTNVMVAYSKYGQGRVVGLVDSSPADDGSSSVNDNLYDGWNELDNGKLITNATIWLSEENTPITSQSIDNIEIAPNPSNGNFNISIPDYQNTKLEVYDINGQLIKNQNINNYNTKINLNNAQNGLYFIKINTNNSIIWKKIIVQ